MENTQTTEKKKRKFNIVDLIFVIIIIAAVVAVAYKFVGKTTEAVSTAGFTVILHSDDVPEEAASFVKVGDTVLDETEKYFGTITDVKIAPARVHGTAADGSDVVSPKEGYVSIDVTVDVSGVNGGNYISLNGKKYTVNTSFTAICGISKMWMRISSLVPAQ